MSSVENFLNADPKPTWEGKELLIMTKYASVTSPPLSWCSSFITEKRTVR